MHYRKKQRFYFTLLLINVLFFVLLISSLAFIPWSSDLKLFLLVLLTVLLALSSVFINSYVQYYQLKYQYFMLRSGAEKPLETKTDFLSKAFLQKREKYGFDKGKSYGNFYIAHRYTNDKSSRFHRFGSLEILVIILNQQMEFDDPSIIDKINRIEDQLASNKQPIQKYYIYAIKEVLEFTEDQLSKANLVQFEQTKRRHITAINMLYSKTNQLVYFLHNTHFSPNAYYDYAISEIKSWL